MGDAERVIERLEPLLTVRRVQRMQAVLATRSDHVAFVFEAMTDPHNLSAALRSLDAFSFQDAHLIRPGDRLRVSRGVTIGSERWLTLHHPPDTVSCMAGLREAGYTIYASHLGDRPGVPLTELDFSRPVALVFGNEHAGVSEEVLDQCDANFRIDMLGFVESLNLSVAVAISAFHARQAIERLQCDAEDPHRYLLGRERRNALYAGWLRRSVKRADQILAEMPFEDPRETG